ncbi:MAG: FAD-dependent thymidylate synthase [Patescibacteria group bacterium]|nr:FAD-dependent thymidylate synthase [Patescibacteria group bacterium]
MMGLYEYTVLTNNNIYDICANAAAQSYNLDLSQKTEEEKKNYIKKIWDIHTNVSEHATISILFHKIPRWATFIMALQRHGFTMTELSQRRNVVSQEEKYLEDLKKGVKKEDARKRLPASVSSSCVVTLNRESAKNIMRFFSLYAGGNEHPRLDYIFDFEVDNKKPLGSPKIWEFVDKEWKGPYYVEAVNREKTFRIALPLYSLHQMIRHRTINFQEFYFYAKAKNVSELYNNNYVIVVCSSDFWQEFVNTRNNKRTQEPLKSIAEKINMFL